VDYVATRDAGKPAAARGIYRVLDDGGMDLPGPRKADPAVHLRRILVYSPANAAGQAKARALKLAKATEDLNRLVRTAGPGFTPPRRRRCPGQGDRHPTPRRGVPAHRDHLRRRRQAGTVLALRPGRDRPPRPRPTAGMPC
jgi:hypothetical protein